MAEFRPTQNDLKDIESLERTFKIVFDELHRTPVSIADAIASLEKRLPALLKANLTVIQTGLQANGTAPLNLTSLPGTPASANQVLEDTHANRLALYSAPTQPVGTLFVETDRNYVYALELVANVNTWVWVGGLMTSAVANIPADLGTTDAGALFFATDQKAQYTWNGSAWKTTGGAIEKPLANATTAYQIQTANGLIVVFNVDTTNHVASIGSASSLGILTLFKAASAAVGGSLVLDNDGSAVGDATAIYFSDGNGGALGTFARASITCVTEGAPFKGQIQFATGVGALTERMRLSGSGGLYVGTTMADPGVNNIKAEGQLESGIATGTPPLVVASTTQVTNLNASKLVGSDWSAPPVIGSVTPSAVVTTQTVLTAADSNNGPGTVTLGNTTGFGAGVAGTGVTTTTKGAGTGPTTPQTIVNYLELDLAGTKYWVPLVQ